MYNVDYVKCMLNDKALRSKEKERNMHDFCVKSGTEQVLSFK